MSNSTSNYHEWEATHRGWILLAPILLANVEDEAPVPIPRWGLSWWYEANLWANDNLVNLIIGLINEQAVGYLFWGVRKLEKPRIVRVLAEES